ncbi:MAG: CHAD domain-containing protein [Bacteroidales bacterium]|nr:CHAD domain-containing protein [Bacteroidales bacterium]
MTISYIVFPLTILRSLEIFHINTKLTLEESLKGVIIRQISFMEDQIRNQADVHKAIHESRKSIKRIRAVLQLIRDEIGYSHYYRENRFYRDLSRRMTHVRDSYVLFETVGLIEHNHPELLPADDFLYLKDRLTLRIEEDLSRFIHSSGGFEEILGDINLARERIDHFCQLRNGTISIRKGIRRIYRRGRRYLSSVQKQFNMDEFHEYRKNTKYLLYHMELFQPIFPKLIKAYANTIDRHAEILGIIRDYDRLELYLQDATREEISPTTRKKLLEKIRDHRQELMGKIFLKSDLIYAEKPKEFVKRINTYWNHHYNLT